MRTTWIKKSSDLITTWFFTSWKEPWKQTWHSKSQLISTNRSNSNDLELVSVAGNGQQLRLLLDPILERLVHWHVMIVEGWFGPCEGEKKPMKLLQMALNWSKSPVDIKPSECIQIENWCPTRLLHPGLSEWGHAATQRPPFPMHSSECKAPSNLSRTIMNKSKIP